GFRLAPDLDPGYAEAFEAATAAGVEAICYACEISTDAIEIARPLPIVT
ncbi:MAG TPA: DNA/RNA nuclease SfsA, partial [Rhodospirillaceae bacterium]|nr:DNA/RNA nuclease SfsA [Rhodospirillaceae bacterium]